MHKNTRALLDSIETFTATFRAQETARETARETAEGWANLGPVTPVLTEDEQREIRFHTWGVTR